MRLEGQAALITGAGSGIGRACALTLAREGCHIGILDKDPKAGQETADQIRALGGATSVHPVDVRDKGQVGEAVAGLMTARGRLDILVNCAGGGAGLSPVTDMKEETWDLVVDVNLKGTFLCCQAAAKIMKERKTGRIVNLASFIAFTGIANAADYAASKGGVVAFTKSLALEMAPYGVTVNAVAPVTTETPLVLRLLSQEVREARAKSIPMGRLGQPQDMADAILFLVLPDSKFITGQTLHVNGGFVMQ